MKIGENKKVFDYLRSVFEHYLVNQTAAQALAQNAIMPLSTGGLEKILGLETKTN